MFSDVRAYAAFVRCHFWFEKMRKWMMSYGQYFCWIQYPSGYFLFCCFCFFSPFYTLHSAEIHYDVRFINRSNLPYMLTPDDLFLLFFMLKTGFFLVNTTKQKSAQRFGEIRPSSLLRCHPMEIWYFYKLFKQVSFVKSR